MEVISDAVAAVFSWDSGHPFATRWPGFALTRIPIVVYYGDNIPSEPSTKSGEDNWRVRLAMARLWTDAINRHGGDATLVHLPEIGIRGNTHFAFSDINNVEVANLMADFVARKGRD